MKLEFYKPDLAEYDKYKEYYCKCIQLCSESSFWAIWDMAETMEAKRAFYKEFYWHKTVWHGQQLWMPPIGDWDSVDWQEMLTEIVPKGTVFGYMPEYLVNMWVRNFPNKIGILEPMNGESDYLYHIDRQIALQGKAYANMRNNRNKFLAQYGERTVFKMISSEEIPAIKAFQEWWMQTNRTNDKACDDLETEHRMIMKMLDLWPMQDMYGVVVYIDGKMAGYVTIAELDTYAAEGHILKADYSYKGIYQYMIDQVYNTLLKDYTIFNAWGDGGIEGLRQTKLAQNPLTMLRKYLISWEG